MQVIGISNFSNLYFCECRIVLHRNGYFGNDTQQKIFGRDIEKKFFEEYNNIKDTILGENLGVLLGEQVSVEFFHDQYKYRGKIDQLFKNDTIYTIAERKFSPVENEVSMEEEMVYRSQTYAYSEGLRNMGAKKIRIAITKATNWNNKPFWKKEFDYSMSERLQLYDMLRKYESIHEGKTEPTIPANINKCKTCRYGEGCKWKRIT